MPKGPRFDITDVRHHVIQRGDIRNSSVSSGEIVRRFLVGAAIAAGMALAAEAALPASETPSFATPGPNEQLVFESDNLQAFVRLNRSGTWCAKTTKIHLYIRDDSVFSGEKKEVSTFIAKLPDILRSQCSKVRGTRVRAFIGKRSVYTASISGIGKKPRVNERITDRKILDKYRTAVAPTASSKDGGGQDQRPGDVQGRIFTAARTVGEQCEVLVEWMKRFGEEYPTFDFAVMNSWDYKAKSVNLLSDAHFVPVFGQPYDAFDSGMRSQIFNEIFRRCPQDFRSAPGVGAVFKNAFHRSQGAFSFEGMAAQVKERREIRAWLKQQGDQLDSIPATSAGFDLLQNLATEGVERISVLWPSEQRSFTSRVLVRKSRVALRFANDRIAALSNDGKSLTALGPIVARAEPHVIDAERAQFEALVEFADRRRQDIRVALVEMEIAALSTYPDAFESLNRILERRHRLLKTVGQTPPLPVIDRYEKARATRSDEMARAILPAFETELAALPVTFSGAKKSFERFAAVSALILATAPDQKGAFEQAALGRANAIYDALIAAAVASMQSVDGGWRDAAPLVARAQVDAAKFDGTRASKRATQIVAAARTKAQSLVEDDVGSLKKELAKTEESWAGLAHLEAIGRVVHDDEKVVATLSSYQPIISARRADVVVALTQKAVGEIEATGDGFEDVERVESLSKGYRERFSSVGAANADKEVYEAMVVRATRLVRTSLPKFKQDIARHDNTRASAEKLQDLATAFDKRAQKWGDFKAYADAARNRLDQVLVAACDAAIQTSGVSSEVTKMGMLGPEQAMSVREFICGIDAHGHTVTEMAAAPAANVTGSTYLMKISQADNVYAYISLQSFEALPKQILLVGTERGDASRQEVISIDQWRVYVATLLDVPVPSDVAARAGGDTLPGASVGGGKRQKLVDRLESATVFIIVNPKFDSQRRFGWHTGTGFFIGPDLIMTNQHVVKRSTDDVHVFSHEIGWKRADYVTGSGLTSTDGLDVAVLRILDYASDAFLRFSSDFVVLQDLVIAGYPGIANDNDKGYADLIQFMIRKARGEEIAYTRGMVPAVKYAFGKLQSFYPNNSNYEVIEHGVQTAKGNSGSAVVNICGEAVGIHFLGDFGGKYDKGTKYNYAYSVHEIVKFLKSRGVDFEVAKESCAAHPG